MRGRSSNTSTAPRVSPRISALPRLGCRLAEASCSSVVFPAPLGPRITQRSPSATSQSRESSSVAPSRRTLTPEKASTSDMWLNLSSGARSTLTGVRELTSAGRLAAWGSAAIVGAVSPDEAADEVRGAREGGHRVVGLPDEPGAVNLAYAFARLRSLGVSGLRLVLPVPGDASGLPGPAAFNERAVGRGEAVLDRRWSPRSGCSASRGPPGRSTRWPPGRAAPLTVRDASRALTGVMRHCADELARMDVARWEPVAAEVLAARSSSARPALPLSAGAEAHGVLEQALRVLDDRRGGPVGRRGRRQRGRDGGPVRGAARPARRRPPGARGGVQPSAGVTVRAGVR